MHPSIIRLQVALKSIFLLLLITLGFFCLEKPGSAVSDFPQQLFTAEAKEMIRADNQLGFRLLSALLQSEGNKSLVTSPANLACALEMLMNGANGQTYKEMSTVLGVNDHTLETINLTNAAILKALQNTDIKEEVAVTASLWGNLQVNFRPQFLNACKLNYQSKVETKDFQSPDTISDINDWVAKSTHGWISTIIDQINSQDVLMLMNATYFRGQWTEPFDPALTERKDFHLADGSTVKRPMMRRKGQFNYFRGPNFEAVNIPYTIRLSWDAGRLSMYILLPDAGVDLKTFVASLDAETWDSWLNKFSAKEGELILPRYTADYEGSLNNALKTLGMTVAFDKALANFSNMAHVTAPICLGQVKHKTFLSVNEEGAKIPKSKMAAKDKANKTSEFTFLVDRPFFFAVRDNRTGMLLFLGSIADPQ